MTFRSAYLFGSLLPALTLVAYPGAGAGHQVAVTTATWCAVAGLDMKLPSNLSDSTAPKPCVMQIFANGVAVGYLDFNAADLGKKVVFTYAGQQFETVLIDGIYSLSISN